MNTPRELYNKTAFMYDEKHITCPMTKWLEKHEEKMIEKFAGGKTLEVGCGTGRWMRKGFVGLDISERMLYFSKRKGLGPLVQGSCEKSPFKPESFDTILCLFGVLNMCDFSESVKEIGRILKPGGTVIMSVASIWDSYKTYSEKKRARNPLRSKKFRVQTERIRITLFEKKELVDVFSKNSLELEHFDSLFILENPKWGSHKKFSFRQRLKLWLDRFLPKDYGAMYLMVFRKIS